MNTEQLSLLEVAYEILSQESEALPITTIIQRALEIKGYEDPDGTLATQLYIDITTSAAFVFCGEGTWYLKERRSLEVYDRDGAYYCTAVEEDDDNKGALDLNDYNIESEDETESSDYDDNDDEDYDDDIYYEDYELPLDDYDPNEDDDEVSYYDEQEYNDIMDDYEDMYEDD